MCRKESSTSRQCPSAQHWGSPPTTSSQPGGIFRPMGRDPGIQFPCLQQRGPPHSVKKQLEALKTPHVVSLLALWKGSRCNSNIVPDEVPGIREGQCKAQATCSREKERLPGGRGISSCASASLAQEPTDCSALIRIKRMDPVLPKDHDRVKCCEKTQQPAQMMGNRRTSQRRCGP